MDSTATELAGALVSQLDKIGAHKRLLVGIAGVPASGKSTFAQMLLKALLKYSTVSAILVGLDGWHYSRSELDAMPNPQLAHDRRGAHWTFDAESYVEFVRALRQDITEDSGVLTAPGFDHANKDPRPGAVCIEPEHRIVIIEGLYTLLSIAPWKEASELLDERWVIRVDAIKARERLIERHVMTRVAKDRQEAIWRADENDGPNGQFLLANMLQPTRVVASLDQ